MPTLALACLLGLANGFAFSWFFGHRAALWRRTVTRPHPLIWLLAIPHLIFWSLSFWFLLTGLTLWVQLEKLPDLVTILDCFPVPVQRESFFAVVLTGWFAFALVWRVSLSSAPSDAQPAWWKVWDIVLAGLFCVMSLYINWLYRAGREFDPELVRLREQGSWLDAFENPWKKAHEHLPVAFLNRPEVQALREAFPRAQKFEDLPITPTFEPWLEEMRPRLKQPHFWTDPETVVMACYGYKFDPILQVWRDSEENPRPTGQLFELAFEMAWISAVVNPDTLYSNEYIFKAASKADLPGHIWSRLIDIGLSRPDLAEAAPLTKQTASEAFISEVSQLENRAEDPPVQYFSDILERQRINQLWRSLPSSPPSPPSRAITLSEFKSQPADRTLKPGSALQYLVMEHNENRAIVVATIVCMELQRLRAEKKPLPTELSQLRPQIRNLAMAYSSWFSLEGEGQQVQVKVHLDYLN